MIGLNIMKSVFLLILIMAGGFIGDVFGCQAKKILETNMYIKHAIFIFLIYFTVDFTSGTYLSPIKITSYTIQLWLFYIMIIRMNIYFTVVVASLLFLLYVTDEYFEYIIKVETEDLIKDTDEDKTNEIIDTFRKKHNHLKQFVDILEYTILLITIIGFISYYLKQKKEKKNFSTMKFLLGNLSCDWQKK